MIIAPVYDRQAITMDGPVGDQRGLVAAQRARMEATLAGFTDEQWRRPSRCEGWTAQDVVAHLDGVNRFWHLSVVAGLAGEPTRVLAGFDPKATPAAMVDAAQSQTSTETLERFAASNRALCDALGALDDEGWSTLAETPPGHIPIRLLAMHALWDAWVHERDILLPQGMAPVEVEAEIASSLRYTAALAPAFARALGSARSGAIAIDVTEPDLHVVVEVGETVRVHGGVPRAGALAVRGPAVDVLEALSLRAPMPHPVPDDQRWLVTGLADVFEETLA